MLLDVPFGPWVTLLPETVPTGTRVPVAILATRHGSRFISRSEMADRAHSTLALLSVATALVAGCAGGGAQIQPLSVAESPPVGALPDSAVVPIDQPVGSATDLYTHIAQGAMSCWFAVGGPLKSDYIFHATADAPSRGGRAEIIIHRRDPTQPNPRGAKSYRIEIEPKGESAATVATENLRMPDAFAGAMREDISRWSKGDQGCATSSTVVGWVPAPPAPPAPAGKPKQTKAKKKANPPPAQAKADVKP